jgi:hypothetical protein
MKGALAAGRALLLVPDTPHYTYQQALQFKHCWSSSKLVLLHPVDPTENLMNADMLGSQGRWAAALPVLAREASTLLTIIERCTADVLLSKSTVGLAHQALVRHRE